MQAPYRASQGRGRIAPRDPFDGMQLAVCADVPLADIDWLRVVSHLAHLAVAYGLSAPIGWDREARSQGAGLRTFPLVAVAACGYLLLGRTVLEGSESQARLLYGLMTGLGFIGGGSILKEGATVHGTATAASVWNTGAIGACVAWQRYEIALVLAIINFATLRFVAPVKSLAGRDAPGAAQRNGT